MATTKGRIGFVDYNLENYHANVYLGILRSKLGDRGFAVTGSTGVKAKASREWAERNSVPYFATVGELNEAVDYYMILAPSNPEVHLALCREVLPFGKATYVDKTFAPNLAAARQIFALAGKHGVPVQTTSALRYTGVQEFVRSIDPVEVSHMVTWGGGGSFGEYAIHPVELAISCMGPGVRRLMRRGTGRHAQLLLDFSRHRTAVVNVYTNSQTPYAASVTTTTETRHFVVDTGEIFANTAAAALDLFASGKPTVDRRESLAIRRILDVAVQKRALKGFAAL